mmetsp:Transcript_106802/g.341136  ORF Transcript_106802/g.341136 Transcript_106802/m.341136 type:complete len:433 (-) Transcript_106802:615-1913(-)
MRLLLIGPSGIPIVVVEVAIKDNHTCRRDATRALVRAAPRQFLRCPSLGGIGEAIEGLATKLTGQTTIGLLFVAPALLPIVFSGLAVEGRARGHQQVAGGHATQGLVRATVSALRDGPTCVAVRQPGLAVVRFALRAALATAKGLLLVVPARLPSGQPGRAIEDDDAQGGRAALALGFATVLQLSMAPTLRNPCRAIELVACNRGCVAAVLLLPGGPAQLPIAKPSVAVVDRGDRRARRLLVIAAPRLFRDIPRLWLGQRAIVRVASFGLRRAAIALLPAGPAGLPSREAGVAIVNVQRRRGRAPEDLVPAAPTLLRVGPTCFSFVHAGIAVIGLAIRPAHATTIVLLRLIPSGFPIRKVLAAVAVLDGLLDETAHLLVLAAPSALQLNPRLSRPLLAIVLIASELPVVAAIRLLRHRPSCFPILQSGIAIE